MSCIAKTRAALAQSPADSELRTLARLLHALESQEPFDLDSLYELDFDRFEAAMGILREWRLARYYDAGGQSALSRMARHADTALSQS